MILYDNKKPPFVIYENVDFENFSCLMEIQREIIHFENFIFYVVQSAGVLHLYEAYYEPYKINVIVHDREYYAQSWSFITQEKAHYRGHVKII